MRLLVAEDDSDCRLLVTTNLARWGYEVVVARDGGEAWALLSAPDRPRLAIVDWMMPGMDGLELCRRVRADALRTPLYLIVLTARTRTEDVVAALQAGADDFVTKPFRREELQARVQVGVRTVALQQSLAERVMQLEDASRQVEQWTTVLQANEARLRALIETAKDGIVTFDLDGIVRDFNPAAEAMSGWSRAEALGQPVAEVLLPPRLHAEHASWLGRFRASGDPVLLTPAFETTGRRRDGAEFPIELSVAAIRLPDTTLLSAIVRDVTERRRLELELRHAQKLESVGRLAAGIAHEINTPIQFVGDNARFLADGFASLRGVLEKYRAFRATAAGVVDTGLVRAVREAERAADLAYLEEEIPKAIDQTLEGVHRVATIVRAMKEFGHPPQGGRARHRPGAGHRARRSGREARRHHRLRERARARHDVHHPAAPAARRRPVGAGRGMRRILFVDDEPRVLEGLRRLLRSRRGEWELVFAHGATAALEALAAAGADVIVSDIRMPGMDGGSLLAHVQKEYPSVVRIVLSGDTDIGITFRALPVAHQFLTKPCEPEILQEVIERAVNLRALLDDEQLRRMVGEMETLPSVPRVYSELTRVLADPEADLTAVVKVVERDVAIYAKILQLVNSAFFGLARRVTSIQQAVNCIGTSMLRTLVLSVEVFRAFDGVGTVPGFSLEGVQDHGLAVARLAGRLLADKRQGESAFMAGMLHDVGQLILATRLPEHFGEALARVRRSGTALHAVEQELLGVTHAELGAYLLGLWGLPYPVVEAVAHHHVPTRVSQSRFDILSAVHVANLLVREQAERSPSALDEPYLAALGVGDRLPAWRQLAAEQADAGA